MNVDMTVPLQSLSVCSALNNVVADGGAGHSLQPMVNTDCRLQVLRVCVFGVCVFGTLPKHTYSAVVIPATG